MELGPSGEPCAMLVADERSPVLIELDPNYMDVIVKRWEDFTGGKAVLEGAGRLDALDIGSFLLVDGGTLCSVCARFCNLRHTCGHLFCPY